MSIKSVAVAGATGWLGSTVTSQLLKDGFEVHALVRNADEAKKKAAELIKNGLKIVQVNFDDVASITQALKGKDALVSTLAGDGSVFVDLQKRLVDASKAAGIKLFIPSEFGANVEAAPKDGFFVGKQLAAAYVKESGVPYAIITVGLFYEVLSFV